MLKVAKKLSVIISHIFLRSDKAYITKNIQNFDKYTLILTKFKIRLHF